MQLELSAEDAVFRDEMRTFFTTEFPQDIRDTVLAGRRLTRDQTVASQRALADAADRVGLQVARARRHIGQEAIQLHGGIAMTAELPVGVGTAHGEVEALR